MRRGMALCKQIKTGWHKTSVVTVGLLQWGLEICVIIKDQL